MGHAKPTLFLSDLHLSPDRPEALRAFHAFAAGPARDAAAVYMLGDIFDWWVGDDQIRIPFVADVVKSMRGISDAGVALYVGHGNRDFLIGERLAQAAGARLLPEIVVLDLHGVRTLLCHGDQLCTDDVEYQAFRRMVRDPRWQQQMLALPVAQRAALAQQVKTQTRARVMAKAEEIMDVNQGTVEATMRRFGVHTLLHGHTHRPNIHRFELDGEPATRIVLGDWHTQGSVLRWDASGFTLESLPR